jgi:hypothetical protein
MIPLEEACGEKFPPGIELHTEDTGRFLKSVLKKMKVDCSPPLTNARMLDKLVGEFIVSTAFLILIYAALTRVCRRRLASIPPLSPATLR